MISEKDLWDFAVDKAIEIWENRAKGEDDSRDCPLCAVAGLLVPLGTENCEICVLKIVIQRHLANIITPTSLIKRCKPPKKW